MAIATISTTSCSKSDDNIIDQTQATVNILPTVNNSTTATRADAAYTTGSIFLYYGNVSSAQTATFTYNNSAWTSNDPLYWNDLTAADGNYKFFALAPAATAAVTVTADQSDATKHAANDQLVAYATTTEQRSTLPLIFKHVLSQLKVTLTTSTDISLTDATLSIAGVKPAYSLTYAENATTPATTTLATENNEAIAALLPLKGEANDFYALLPAQTFTGADAANKLTLKFTVDGKSYTWSNSGSITTEAGKNMDINININKSGIELASDIKLTDWETSATDDGGDVVVDK